jgi:hypothetical protein
MAKKLGLVLGIVFLLVGVLGFVNNPLVGSLDSLFATNTAHDLVHVITGLLFIFIALKNTAKIGITLKVFGVVYLLVAILGFLAVDATGQGTVLGFLALNSADNWLHVVLAIVVFAGGVLAGKESATPAQPQAPVMNV